MKKVIIILLFTSGISLLVVALGVKIFPEWLAIPGSILSLLGLFVLVFDKILDWGSKLKDLVDLFFGKEKKNVSSELKTTHEDFIKTVQKRMNFLDNITDNADATELEKDADDLVRFIKDMPHGIYYADKIRRLTAPSWGVSYNYLDDKAVDILRVQINEGHKNY